MAIIRNFRIAVNSYLSLKKTVVEWGDFLQAIDYVDRYGIGFGDVLILQRMKKSKISEIYSNDEDFDRVEW